MALFWFLAGMLTALASLIVILPWLRTKPRLGALSAVPWQVMVGAAVIVGTVLGLYHWLGHPELLAQNAAPSPPAALGRTAGSPNAASAAGGAGSMTSAIASLEARLAKGGGSADDWELLAKSYDFLGRPEEAAKARARQLPALPMAADANAMVTASSAAPVSTPTLSPESLKLLAKASRAKHDQHFSEAATMYAQLAARGQLNADGWADYADTAAAVQDRKLAGAPETYIAKALALDPDHPKALWLKASADEEAGRFADAVRTWKQLQAVLPANSPDLKIVTANSQHDVELAAAAGTPPAPAGAGAATSRTTVSGEVSLAPELIAKGVAGATLFIVAKSVDSPGAPVAVYRGSVGSWPVKFTLDDSQSMLPRRNLSTAGRVTIEARISKSGQALPTAGDLKGSTGVINPADHQPLKIVIDQVIS